MNKEYRYKVASISDLERRWDKNIADNIGDDRWVKWMSESIENHKNKIADAVAEVVLLDKSTNRMISKNIRYRRT